MSIKPILILIIKLDALILNNLIFNHTWKISDIKIISITT
jgi:hypothetical protein